MIVAHSTTTHEPNEEKFEHFGLKTRSLYEMFEVMSEADQRISMVLRFNNVRLKGDNPFNETA